MSRRRVLTRALLAIAAFTLMPGLATAQCSERPQNACELVNGDREIFLARILSPTPDDPLVWRVRVIRSYRGNATGDISLQVWGWGDLPGFADLEVGKDYLFYVYEKGLDGSSMRSTPLSCGDWLPASDVSRNEFAFLEHLGTPASDGRISGVLENRVGVTERKALPGVRVSVFDQYGLHQYSALTDGDGHFAIGGLPAGSFRVATDVDQALLVSGHATIELAPHACYDTYLTAEPNTMIRGRLSLPSGVKVDGTRVVVMTPDGAVAKDTYADSDGRYEIHGLDPGEYIVGINVGLPPSVDAPFPPTYAPGTSDIDRAARYLLAGQARISDADITIAERGGIATIYLKGSLEDGRPAAGLGLEISRLGYGSRGAGTTNADGLASVQVVKGTALYLSGGTLGVCVAPVALGPDLYPERLDVVATADGCRENFNLAHLGAISAGHSQLGRTRVRVTTPDGHPVYKAQVGIASQKPTDPFVSAFLTDQDGYVDLPIPFGQEFTVDVQSPCGPVELLVNTEDGVRWQQRPDSQTVATWEGIAPSTGAMTLTLPACSSRQP